jgi:hypothetical protein
MNFTPNSDEAPNVVDVALDLRLLLRLPVLRPDVRDF